MTSIKQTTAPKSRASTTAARGYAAQSATTPLAPFSFERRATGRIQVRNLLRLARDVGPVRRR